MNTATVDVFAFAGHTAVTTEQNPGPWCLSTIIHIIASEFVFVVSVSQDDATLSTHYVSIQIPVWADTSHTWPFFNQVGNTLPEPLRDSHLVSLTKLGVTMGALRCKEASKSGNGFGLVCDLR